MQHEECTGIMPARASQLPTMVCESAGGVEVWLRWKFTVCRTSIAVFADGSEGPLHDEATGTAHVWIVKDALANGGHGNVIPNCR